MKYNITIQRKSQEEIQKANRQKEENATTEMKKHINSSRSSSVKEPIKYIGSISAFFLQVFFPMQPYVACCITDQP